LLDANEQVQRCASGVPGFKEALRFLRSKALIEFAMRQKKGYFPVLSVFSGFWHWFESSRGYLKL
jgi:hypothetical protein